MPTNPAHVSDLPHQTVLIVEDEFAVANDLRQILEKVGYTVSGIAFSVDKALELNRQQRSDLVLLDIHLKGLQTGIDLACTLSQEDIPFVYVSANTNAQILEEVKTTQPYGFIVKPFREKDVLVALEIAHFRHAHNLETRLRQEKALQMAVNNALMTIKEQNALCREIANQINQLVPYSTFGLRVGSVSGQMVYSISLQKALNGQFEPLSQSFLADLNKMYIGQEHAETHALWQEEVGVFNGEDFEQLCRKYLLYQKFRVHLGCQAAIRFRFSLNGMPASMVLASSEPYGFTQAHQELVQLIIPQISLALENLFAFEEMQSRERIKSAELAILNAFTSGAAYSEIVRQVAVALHEIIPCDLFSIYQAGMKLEGSEIDATVIREAGVFVPFALTDLLSNPEDQPRWQKKLDEISELYSQTGIYVGEQHRQIADRNEITQMYNDALGLRSMLIVPIPIKDKVIASIVLASKAAFAFTEKDLAVLQQISLQMALGFENRLAFQRIKALGKRLALENTYLQEEVKTTADFEQIIGQSPLLLNVFKSISRVAPTDYTVLILGETGTGKELIARAVHNRSARKEKALIKVNCAALPPQLIESELFGHEKGSFTGATEKRVGKFELAHGGTIFLDEIGELPLELQPKLLRVLQEKEVERIGGKGPIPCDVRIIAATNRNLQAEKAANRFRADLYYRLNVFPIALPPLRERKEDLLALSSYFLQKIAKKLGKPISGLSEESLGQMHAYGWPGNVRELEHLLERAAIMSTSPVVSLVEPLVSEPFPAASTPDQTPVAEAALPSAKPAVSSLGEVKSFGQAERDNILAALQKSNYRIRGKGGAAELLKIKPTTLESKMARMGIVRNR